jgi:hypothetical protein
MNDTNFTAAWTRIDTPPVSGTRCLVSDGDVVVIATYIIDSDSRKFWIFSSNAGEREDKTFDVQGWMPLPRPIQKLVKAVEAKTDNEKTMAEDETSD